MSKNKKNVSFYEIRLPLSETLMDFISQPTLPAEDIREILGVKIPEHKYTLFNLYSFVSAHFLNDGREAKVYKCSERLSKFIHVNKDVEYTESEISNLLLKYIKDNNLIHPSTWFYFLPDDNLRKILSLRDSSIDEYSCYKKQKQTSGVYNSNENPYCDIFRLNRYVADDITYQRNNKLYRISDQLADFLEVPRETEMNNKVAFEHILRYIKENDLQDETGRGINVDTKLETLLKYKEEKEKIESSVPEPSDDIESDDKSTDMDEDDIDSDDNLEFCEYSIGPGDIIH